jgi:hypothetical protein
MNGGVTDIIVAYMVIDTAKPTCKNTGVFIAEKQTPGFRLTTKIRR